MQRDFIEPGGFGETLGNNVKLLAAIVPTVKKLLEFLRPPSTRVGRQSQAWARMPDGWRVVAAHVSLIEEKK